MTCSGKGVRDMVGIMNGVKENAGMKVRGTVRIREEGRVGCVFHKLLGNVFNGDFIFSFSSIKMSPMSKCPPYKISFTKLPCFEAQLD